MLIGSLVLLVALTLAPAGSAMASDPACCQPSGTCENLDTATCTGGGGTSLAGRKCSDPQACDLGGSCVELDAACCEDAGGTPLLASLCSDFGGCCSSANACQDIPFASTVGGCLASGATPVVSGCAPFEQPCCTADGGCQALDAGCCKSIGGTPVNNSGNTGTSSCDSVDCCLPDGTSATLSPCTCRARGGQITPDPTCCGPSTTTDPAGDGLIPEVFGPDAAVLCAAFHGFPAPPSIIPPPNPIDPTTPRHDATYAARLEQFLRRGDYRNLGWLRDAFPRESGPYAGVFPPSKDDGTTYSTHHVVRVWYSPEVVGWLCRGGFPCGSTNADCIDVSGRLGFCAGPPFGACSDASDCDPGIECTFDLEPGAMIVKEMWKSTGATIEVDPTSPLCASNSDCGATGRCDSGGTGRCIAGAMYSDETCYPSTFGQAPQGWAVMVRGSGGTTDSSDGSHDGWYWTVIGDWFDYGTPPVLGRSGVTQTDFFDAPASIADHDPSRSPTGNQSTVCSISGDACKQDSDCGPSAGSCVRRQGSVVDPNAGFNQRQDCLVCHASATSAATFANLNNILGGDKVEPYRYCGAVDSGDPACPAPAGACDIAESAHTGSTRAHPQHDYTKPLASPDPTFLAQFTQFGASEPDTQTAIDSRLPAQTYDHVVSSPSGPSLDNPNTQVFLTADQCQGCHGATSTVHVTPDMTQCVAVECASDQDCVDFGCGASAVCTGSPARCMVGSDLCVRQINLSPFSEWSASPMGLAGRDPIFYAQLESETNRWPTATPGTDCIETLCLHCHAAMGQRQLELDVANTGTDECQDLFNTTLFGPGFGFDTDPAGLITRGVMDAWPGHDPSDPVSLGDSKYGALGRDGVSCAVCHRVNDPNLGNPSSFNGFFEVGPADEIYGPYASAVESHPMQQALGITPGDQPLGQLGDSALCGSCHAINLPILDTGGAVCGFDYEQTTYLEWLNSEFTIPGGSNPQSCQDCHMPDTYHTLGADQPIGNDFAIANVQVEGPTDFSGWPANAHTAVEPLSQRQPYARHLLYGLNVFLNEMFQQFSVFLGFRQLDPMNTDATLEPALHLAREAVLEQASNKTADLTIDSASIDIPSGVLTADVTVTNKSGHKFPSGVGFRRAFVEFKVLNSSGVTLWSSGEVNDIGAIIEGESGPVLASEFFDDSGGAGPGCAATAGADAQCYQPHHEVIDSEDQVQIYEELTLDIDNCSDSGPNRFTTSFLSRSETRKDNRLLPVGWTCDGPYGMETRPWGEAACDSEYGCSAGCLIGDPKECSCPSAGTPVGGSDTVQYQVSLSPVDAAAADRVQVRLYFQATPPYYLNDRFDDASSWTAKKDTDIGRLYYITSRLNVTDARADDGEAFLEDWRLQVGPSPTLPLTVVTTSTTTTTITATTTTSTTSTTTVTVPPLGQCPATPVAGCRDAVADSSRVTLRTKGLFRWTLKDGNPTTDLLDFKDPVRQTPDYNLCVYDGVGQALMSMSVPTGPGSGWKTRRGPTGYKYFDKPGSPDGIRRMIIKTSSASRPQIRAVGKGANVPIPALPATLPLTVQMLTSDGSGTECWEAEFTVARKNRAELFRAKGP